MSIGCMYYLPVPRTIVDICDRSVKRDKGKRRGLGEQCESDKVFAASLPESKSGHAADFESIPLFARPTSLPPFPFSNEMTTIPARLATATRASVTAQDARHRAIQLYREWYRSVR